MITLTRGGIYRYRPRSAYAPRRTEEPLLCQGLLERYGADHVRSARARIARELALVLDA
jgi:hypothetical protein